jgi:signal transduction histidine kinase
MRFRNVSLRTKVTALLVSLAALWSFAAWVTLRDGVNLLWVSTNNTKIVQPGNALVVALQEERRLSVIALAKPTEVNRAPLVAQRARTDQAVATFVRSIDGTDVKLGTDSATEQRFAEVRGRLRAIGQGRLSVDSGLVDRRSGAETYSTVIESIFQIYDSLATLDDKRSAEDTRTIIEVNRSWSLLEEEDALLSGALAAGRITSAEHMEFAQLVGARRVGMARALVDLRSTDPIAYRSLTTSVKLGQLQAMEDQVLQRSMVTTRPFVTAVQWHSTAVASSTELQQRVHESGERLVGRATPIAAGVIIRLLLAGGLGLIAVIASIVVSITTARALVRQLERLRDAALELSERRLPGVVERLGRGEQVDVATEAPPLEFGADDIGRVGQAFNTVQETAIRTAVEQAELRRGIRDILLSLARRTQTLVRRQLTILDVMERRELDPTELEDLFRIDHLATRMRRNAENLIVLSGATPARGWRRSVAMVDVLRAAVAEVEDYSRVNVLPTGQVALVGRAVGDVTHLLAELIENAVTFSPSYTTVEVGGRMAASGYAIEIDDRGLGMTDENLVTANEQIASSPEFNLSSTARLGLYVVSRLADRYGIRVSLKHSAYGGTTAVVLIPRDLVVDDADAIEAPREPQDDRADASLVGAAVVAGRGDQSAPAGAHGAALVEAVTKRDRLAEPAAEPPVTEPPALRSVPPQRAALPRRGGREQGTAGRGADGNGANGANGNGTDGNGTDGTTTAPARPRSERVQPEESMTADEASHTPSGLPVRVPQANLAPALRNDAPLTAKRMAEDDNDGRSPEEIRRSLGAYQTGTQRGRVDAARQHTGPQTSLPPADDEPSA